jgi:predicted RNA-binding protein with RPS1 domain
MYHLSGYSVCYVQHLNTLLTVGDAVKANLLVAVQHNHRVLSIRAPISMLSTRLAAVELVMPRMTSSLRRAFPSVPSL